MTNIHERAYIAGSATVAGPATVSSARVQILDKARLSGLAEVGDDALLRGNVHVYGWAKVSEYATVAGDATVHGAAKVYGGARVHGDANVTGNAHVYGSAVVTDDAQVHGNARVYGMAYIGGSASVGTDADVFEPGHVLVLTGLFHGDSVTVYRTATGHRVQAGCQNFTLNDDLESLARDHGWELPTGWSAIAEGLKAYVATWHAE